MFVKQRKGAMEDHLDHMDGFFEDELLDFQDIEGEEVTATKDWEEGLPEEPPLMDMAPEDLLAIVEGRRDLVVKMDLISTGNASAELLQHEEDEPVPGQRNCKFHETKSPQCNTFRQIFAAMERPGTCFDESKSSFKSRTACMERLQAMFQPMKDFSRRVRIAEGLLFRPQL